MAEKIIEGQVWNNAFAINTRKVPGSEQTQEELEIIRSRAFEILEASGVNRCFDKLIERHPELTSRYRDVYRGIKLLGQAIQLQWPFSQDRSAEVVVAAANSDTGSVVVLSGRFPREFFPVAGEDPWPLSMQKQVALSVLKAYEQPGMIEYHSVFEGPLGGMTGYAFEFCDPTFNDREHGLQVCWNWG